MARLIWIIPLTVTVGWIATMTRDATIEQAKQSAFMMKACVDAGGEWKKGWGMTWDCVRLDPRQ